jgi:hypothetical protein
MTFPPEAGINGRHMKKKVRYMLLWLCIASLPAFGATAGKSGDDPHRASEAQFASDQRLVRRAYETLARYNQAAQIQDLGLEGAALSQSLALRFTFDSFRAGTVDELQNVRFSSLATPISGLVISGARQVTTLAGGTGGEEASYLAQWVPATYSSGDDYDLTFGEYTRLQPERYARYDRYLTYQVTATMNGASRTYQAAAFFTAAGAESVPMFIDRVVNKTGALYDFWNETRRPVSGRGPVVPAIT